MPLKKITPLFVVLALLIFNQNGTAQKLVIDSLNRALKQATSAEKPVLLAELARSTFEQNIDQALNTGKQALNLAKKNKDHASMGFCYATIAHLLVQKNQEQRAGIYIDSAVSVSKLSKKPILNAFVWFRKGWFELVKGNDSKAMSHFLQAEKLIADHDDRRSSSYKTLINHYIAGIYAYGSDTLKQHKYAKACLVLSKKSAYPDDIQIGYMTYAHSFFSSFERNLDRRNLLDSSLNYYRRAMVYYNQNHDKILIQSNAALTALNMGNAYFKYFPNTYKDSTFKYVQLALHIARRFNGREVLANCYGILSEYALREKDFKGAEQYLVTGISELENSSGGADITRSRLMLGLANVAEKSGDIKRALNYYKQYSAYYSKVFDLQKLSITQQLEEEYQSAQRENEILRLKERTDYNRRLNWLYILIGSAGITVLALLLSSYHYKLKASLQQKKLSEQEKEEAELLAKLKDAEAQRLALEKQEVELQASLRAEESIRLKAEQELLQDRAEWLEKELLAGTLKIEEKNVILNVLKEKSRDVDAPMAARQISRIINQNLRMDKNLDEQQQALNKAHPNFFNALQQRAENHLTRLDLKYCSYILMGLDNKEIASRLGVEPKSIRMARYRLKQKLKLEKEENLDRAIREMDQI